jgi:site-specific recombinase XerD
MTEAEVEVLMGAAKQNLQGHRDATMILLAFRHGLRASELIDLRWEQVDLDGAVLHVRRVKSGTPATHPLTGRELRALRRLQREQEPKSPFVFISQRRVPFTNRGFQAMVDRAGQAAGLELKVHPHMLRHGCGYKLANDGVDTRTIQAFLGHKSIQHTVRYTELSPTRFNGLWRDWLHSEEPQAETIGPFGGLFYWNQEGELNMPDHPKSINDKPQKPDLTELCEGHD